MYGHAGTLPCTETPSTPPCGQAASRLADQAGKSGGNNFQGVRVMCYDSAAWVRKNFKAKADKHNEVGTRAKPGLLLALFGQNYCHGRRGSATEGNTQCWNVTCVLH